MGRAAFALGTPDGGAGVVDGSASGLLCPENRSSGPASLGPPRTGPVLPGPATGSQEGFPIEEPRPEPDVMLHQIWMQLSVPDRQRFGHCFSFMVLKALGLRPCPSQEVEA